MPKTGSLPKSFLIGIAILFRVRVILLDMATHPIEKTLQTLETLLNTTRRHDDLVN